MNKISAIISLAMLLFCASCVKVEVCDCHSEMGVLSVDMTLDQATRAASDEDLLSTAVVNIYLDDSSTLTLTRDSDTIFLSDPDSILNIYGFEDNRIYVGESNSVHNVLGNIKAYGDLEGNDLISSGLTIQNGWLVAAAVPEPAEWAMIFGTIALGLAIYRRRK